MLYEAFHGGRGESAGAVRGAVCGLCVVAAGVVEGEALSKGLEYWKQQLAGIPERLELPTDRSRPAMQTFEAEVCQVELSGEQVKKLKRVSRENQATLYMTLLAGLGVLMSRYSGQDDIVVGSPIANRQEAQLEGMIGFFVNSLVMRVKVKGEGSFRELLSEVRKTALESVSTSGCSVRAVGGGAVAGTEFEPDTDLSGDVRVAERTDGCAAAGWTGGEVDRERGRCKSSI